MHNLTKVPYQALIVGILTIFTPVKRVEKWQK
jgi:hypothetical protein